MSHLEEVLGSVDLSAKVHTLKAIGDLLAFKVKWSYNSKFKMNKFNLHCLPYIWLYHKLILNLSV